MSPNQAFLVTDCPRCGSHSVAFDALVYQFSGVTKKAPNRFDTQEYALRSLEICSVCRHCERGVIFITRDRQSQSNPSNVFVLNNACNLLENLRSLAMLG